MTATANTAAPFAILPKAELDNRIKTMGGKFTGAGASLHQCAASALHHAEKHGCTARCDAIYKAIPAGVRKAYVQWMEHMGRVKFDSAKGQFAFAKKRKFLADEMMTISPMDFAKPSGSAGGGKAPTPSKELAALVKRIESIAAKAEEIGVDLDRLTGFLSGLDTARKCGSALADILATEESDAADAEKEAAMQSALEAGSAAQKAATEALEKAESEAATARKGKGKQPAARKPRKGKVQPQTASKPRAPKGGKVLEPVTVH